MNAEIKRNIRIGVFAVIAFAILCFGLNYLKGKDIFSSGAKLDAYFANLDGLTEACPVMFSGYKVGSVTGIVLDQYAENPNRRFKIVINIEKSLDVPIDSRVEIINTDLLGSKGVEIFLGKSTEMAENGDTITSCVRAGLLDELMPMKDQATTLMTNANVVLQDIDTILDPQNKAHLDHIFRDLAQTVADFKSISANLKELTKASGDLTTTMANFRQMSESMTNGNHLDAILANADSIASDIAKADLAGTLAHLDAVLKGADAALTGDGNIGRLMTDTTIYDNLTNITENLNRLLVDLRLNPSRYINISAVKFGGKQVYFSDLNSASQVMTGTVYAVCLTTTSSPKDIAMTLCGQRVYEYHAGKKYKYLVLFQSQDDAQTFINTNSLATDYPDVAVETYVNGELQS